MKPQEALAALGRQAGMELAFNEQGLCRLRFDGRYVVDLEISDDEREIFLYSRLGPLPGGEGGSGLLKRMMRAQYLGRETGRAAFGLDGDTLMAFCRVGLEGEDERALPGELERFLDTLETWKTMLGA